MAGASLSCSSVASRLSCASMFNDPEDRFSATGPLFPMGYENSLFYSRMIRPARRRDLPETTKKELSTKEHEGRRRATKKTGRGKRNPRRDALPFPAFGVGPEREKTYLHGWTGCTGLSSSTALPRSRASRVSFRASQPPLQQRFVLSISCSSCLSMFPDAADRFNGTWAYSRQAMKVPCFSLV